MGERRRYASSTDVARLAGVSQSAVSRTYTEGRSVSPQTRAKVLAAAGQLGYRPSLIPRIMLTHRSYLVAIVVGGMYNPFYAAVLEQFAVKLPEIGFQPLLVHVESGDSLDDALPRLASYRVDAVVSALAIRSARSAGQLAQLAIPVIAFNTSFRNAWVSSVSADNERAGRVIADLFLNRGGSRFGFIAGARSSTASEARLKGYRAGLRSLGILDVEVARADFRYEDGAAAAAELYRDGVGPDAIFCANDLIALGAMDTLRHRLGRRVPDDVLVAGFDDIPAASWVAYELTTFVQDSIGMVAEAVALLLAATASALPFGGRRVVLPSRLVERDSTTRSPAAHIEAPTRDAGQPA
jgi:DNA-binding LacI/PurR family transcriptional regulator